MILFLKGEWKLKISLDFTGIYRNPQETTGIYRILQEITGICRKCLRGLSSMQSWPQEVASVLWVRFFIPRATSQDPKKLFFEKG